MDRGADFRTVGSAFARFRRVPVDGGLLLFDRDSGWNALLEGEETASLTLGAPRFVQFAITNRCNLACTFCSRDTATASRWTAEEAFTLLRDLAVAGVLEVAFGGGEPFAFPGFVDLVTRLHEETPLAVSVTTNGLLLDSDRLRRLKGRSGQIRLSLYDDNDWRRTVTMLVAHGARFGVNYLVTPQRLAGLEGTVLELAALGCTDVLLLSYNGRDSAMHLSVAQTAELSVAVDLLHRALRGRVGLKLDVCWGERLEAVPQILRRDDCGAGKDFVVVTSDRQLSPCSFHDLRLPFRDAADLLRLWRERQDALAGAAPDPGCARLEGMGLR